MLTFDDVQFGMAIGNQYLVLQLNPEDPLKMSSPATAKTIHLHLEAEVEGGVARAPFHRGRTMKAKKPEGKPRDAALYVLCVL